MNKAKALFSGVMILAVAGTSAVCWYLNDQGIIGNDETTEPDAYIFEYDNDNDYYQDNFTPDFQEEKTTSYENKEDTENKTPITDVNEFLSIFSKVYFSEKNVYSPDSRSTYELLRFAYAHISRTNAELIEVRQEDDEIGYYNCVPSDAVNAVLKEYLDITVPNESIYTENNYAFFKYIDGYFCTPAADGLAYINTTVAESVTENDNEITVQFTIYSNEEIYAEGEAVIKKTDSGMKLDYYSIETT